MILKIISGGQTGADRAALDFAIKMDIPHGSWIPKGRLTEAGPLPEKYQLQEMPTKSYPKRTEQNVLDSDGTVIFSHGELTGGSKFKEVKAAVHDKPCLHIDLTKKSAFQASQELKAWIVENSIEVLNVAGPRASKDPKIYRAVMDILETFWYLALAEGSYAMVHGRLVPKTVKEAVDRLLVDMPLREKVVVAKMTEDQLINLHFTVGAYIRNQFALWSGNLELLKDCKKVSGKPSLHPDDAASVIIRELWNRLRETHKLKVLK